MPTTATLPYPLFDADNRLHFADAFRNLPLDGQARIMGGNLARLVTV